MAKEDKGNGQLVPFEAGGMTSTGGYEAEAGQGMEEATHESFAIPMLRILHKQSPQCDPDNGVYVQGAKQGSIFNTITREITDEVIVVPCHYRMTFIEWVPRTSGGGFVAEHRTMPLESKAQSKGPNLMPNGNEVQETMNHYCLLMRPDMSGADAVLISMASVQRKKSRNWMTAIRGKVGTRPNGETYPLPSFACSYRFTTVPEQNEKGNWAGWLIDAHQWVKEGSALYDAAKALKKSVSVDVVEVDRSEETAEEVVT